MTGAREGIDPRYDARFQRGYDGHGADASAAGRAQGVEPTVAATASGTGASGTAAPIVSEASSAASTASVASPAENVPVERDTDEELDLFAVLEPDHDDAADLERDDDSGRTDPVRRDPLDSAPVHTGIPDEDDGFGPAPEPAAEPLGRRTWVWLAAGWAVTGAVTVIGAWLSWLTNADTSWYASPSPAEDPTAQLLRTLGWAMSPSLLMAGGVGLVVVTAMAARLCEADSPRSGFARSAAWWVLVAIAAAGLIAMPGLIGAIQETIVLNSGIVVDGNGMVVDDTQQAQLDAMARGQFAQAVIGTIALTVVAAVVAVVVHEAHRALRRPAARSTQSS